MYISWATSSIFHVFDSNDHVVEESGPRNPERVEESVLRIVLVVEPQTHKLGFKNGRLCSYMIKYQNY